MFSFSFLPFSVYVRARSYRIYLFIYLWRRNCIEQINVWYYDNVLTHICLFFAYYLFILHIWTSLANCPFKTIEKKKKMLSISKCFQTGYFWFGWDFSNICPQDKQSWISSIFTYFLFAIPWMELEKWVPFFQEYLFIMFFFCSLPIYIFIFISYFASLHLLFHVVPI